MVSGLRMACFFEDVLAVFSVVVFFKQKTAYEMRISDWSSDVCSSDLRNYPDLPTLAAFAPCRQANFATLFSSWNGQEAPLPDRGCKAQIGRASCRESVCQYV